MTIGYQSRVRLESRPWLRCTSESDQVTPHWELPKPPGSSVPQGTQSYNVDRHSRSMQQFAPARSTPSTGHRELGSEAETAVIEVRLNPDGAQTPALATRCRDCARSRRGRS